MTREAFQHYTSAKRQYAEDVCLAKAAVELEGKREAGFSDRLTPELIAPPNRPLHVGRFGVGCGGVMASPAA